MQKGLFNSLFILIMLVMFVPSLSLMTKTQNVLDTKYQIEELTFTADSIIADALSDRTYLNSCSVDSKDNYDTIINTYLNNFETQRKNKSSITCSFSNLTTSLSLFLPNYIGFVDITCSSENDVIKVDIIKRLNFSKNISAVNGSSCNVKIADNYNGGYIQVDLNKS